MTDQNAKYNVIFEGRTRNGEDPGLVKTRLASLFKVDTAVIERIFKDSPTAIQKNKDYEAAIKYKEAVEKTGAVCRVEAQTAVMPPPVPSPPVAPPQTGPAQRPQGTLYTPPPPPLVEEEEAPEDTEPAIQSIQPAAWKSLGIGLGITVIVLFFPFLSFVFHYLVTLVHEFGHAVLGWLHGYPTIPAFDFAYGGGVAIHQERNTLIIIAVYALFGWLFYLYRKNPLTLTVLAAAVILHTIATFTAFHEVLIIFMGHGFELIFAVLFFYRALSGSSIVVPAERPLYAFLGFFIVFTDFRFAHRLVNSPFYRAEYGAAKGGGHWMDFSRLANEFFHVELSTVAAFFLALCILTPVAAFLIYRYKKYLAVFFKKLIYTQV